MARWAAAATGWRQIRAADRRCPMRWRSWGCGWRRATPQCSGWWWITWSRIRLSSKTLGAGCDYPRERGHPRTRRKWHEEDAAFVVAAADDRECAGAASAQMPGAENAPSSQSVREVGPATIGHTRARSRFVRCAAE